MTKYKAVPTYIDGKRFASKKEAGRYQELLLLLKTGYIKNLELQPKVPLIVNGKKIGNYIGDFKYFCCQTNKEILEDVKSPVTKTPVYNLKKKILLTYKKPITITEV